MIIKQHLPIKLAIIFWILFSPFVSGKDLSTKEMIESFVEDFRNDSSRMNRELTFGVAVDTIKFHVISDGKGKVTLNNGFPEEPTFYYKLDTITLKKIYSGQLSVITAMGRANMSDPAPMDLGFMEGHQMDPVFFDWIIEYTFHFWTRGFPEIIRFGDESKTRIVHGANVTGLYYQKGFRSAWYQIKKGQHINASPNDQRNPFPTLIMFTSGQAEAKIGGKQMILQKGDSVLIPKDISHEFWNDEEKAAEFFIIMFGDGA